MSDDASDLGKEIGNLHAKTARNRYQFLKAEIDSCRTGIDMGEYEFSVGNTAVTEKEIAMVQKGIEVIHRFLPYASPEEQVEVQAKTEKLEAALDALKAKLNQ